MEKKLLLQHFCKVLEGHYVDNRVINGAQYIIMMVVCHNIAGIVNEAVSVENYAHGFLYGKFFRFFLFTEPLM